VIDKLQVSQLLIDCRRNLEAMHVHLWILNVTKLHAANMIIAECFLQYSIKLIVFKYIGLCSTAFEVTDIWPGVLVIYSKLFIRILWQKRRGLKFAFICMFMAHIGV
jgi:hypothetical protein